MGAKIMNGDPYNEACIKLLNAFLDMCWAINENPYIHVLFKESGLPKSFEQADNLVTLCISASAVTKFVTGPELLSFGVSQGNRHHSLSIPYSSIVRMFSKTRLLSIMMPAVTEIKQQAPVPQAPAPILVEPVDIVPGSNVRHVDFKAKTKDKGVT